MLPSGPYLKIRIKYTQGVRFLSFLKIKEERKSQLEEVWRS